LALAGLLLPAKFGVPEAEAFIGAIAKISGNDGEVHTNTVKSTKAAMDAGKKITGWKRLSELLNVGLPIANVPEWLGYTTGQIDEEMLKVASELRAEGESSPWQVPAHWRWLDVADRQNWQCTPLVWTVQDLVAQGNFVIVAAETQTGKTLFGLFLAHSILNPGELFGRLPISPVQRVLYMGLEDPDRRFDARLADIEHTFPKVEPGRFIVHTAPDFKLTDESMVAYLEDLIVTHQFALVFIDTYQKATPGLTSFDDEKQAVILHRLANLTRKLGVTIVVLDHVRKRQNGTRRTDLTRHQRHRRETAKRGLHHFGGTHTRSDTSQTTIVF
jgi:hypothetical protein